MTPATAPIRSATASDAEQLIHLWDLLFDEVLDELDDAWKRHARPWFDGAVNDEINARFPVIEVDGAIVATAIGTLELGVPNPQSSRGRLVRLANVITLPEHRRRGFGSAVVRDVIAWANSIDADRVDLSTTAEGRHIYEQVGFVLTKAPRMKLVL